MRYTVKAKFNEWLTIVDRERGGEITLPSGHLSGNELVRLLEGAFNAGWAEGMLHAKDSAR